jgi:hypothetical protein
MRTDKQNQLTFEYEPRGVSEHQPLIYLWEIMDGSGAVRYRYVGKASGGAERPLRHYGRNVANLLAGRPYRRGKPDGFRAAHRRLADATSRGWPIRLSLLCNVPPGQDINSIEERYRWRLDLDDWC